MSRWEEKDHAAEWLGDETRRPRSGITARTPRPARESLYSFDLESAGFPTSLPVSTWDEHDRDDDGTSALARLMDALLERLSPRQREALNLCAIGGLSYGEAAKEMGVSKATLYAHYRDAIARMRALLESLPWAAAIVGPWLTAIDNGDDAPDDDPAGGGAVVPLRRLPPLDWTGGDAIAA